MITTRDRPTKPRRASHESRSCLYRSCALRIALSYSARAMRRGRPCATVLSCAADGGQAGSARRRRAVGQRAVVGLVRHGYRATETAVLEFPASAAPQSRTRARRSRTHSTCSCVRLLRLAGMEPLSWLYWRYLQMQAPPQPRTRARRSHTHSVCSCVRLLRLAGMEPLSWLFSRALQMQALPQPRTHARRSRTHSCTSCVRLLRLAGMEPLSWLL